MECSHCDRDNDSEFKTCQICRNIVKQSRARRRQKIAKDPTLCTRCGGPKAILKYNMCKKCREKGMKQNRKQRKRGPLQKQIRWDAPPLRHEGVVGGAHPHEELWSGFECEPGHAPGWWMIM